MPELPFMYSARDLSELVLFLLKGGLSKAARDEVAAASAQFVSFAAARRGIELQASLNPTEEAALSALRHAGFAPIADVFSGPEIDEICQYLSDKLVTYKVDTEAGVEEREVPIGQLPENVPLAQYKTSDLCRSPLIYKIVHDERLISLAGAYLGAPPSVSAVATWWSFPDRTRSDKGQLFHHDRDDFSILKLFVYLTDVTSINGPHAYLLKTHTMSRLQQVAATLKPATKATFWKWMEVLMKPDNEVFSVFGSERMNVATGPRGTSFLEDTRGLHRAVYPQEGSRLAFELTYTVLPKFNEIHKRLFREELDFPFARVAPSPLIQYATRLLFH